MHVSSVALLIAQSAIVVESDAAEEDAELRLSGIVGGKGADVGAAPTTG